MVSSKETAKDGRRGMVYWRVDRGKNMGKARKNVINEVVEIRSGECRGGIEVTGFWRGSRGRKELLGGK